MIVLQGIVWVADFGLAYEVDAEDTEPDTQVKLINVETAIEIATLQSPDQATIHDLAFSPDGALLVAATTDHSIPVWDFRAVRHELAKVGIDREMSNLKWV